MTSSIPVRVDDGYVETPRRRRSRVVAMLASIALGCAMLLSFHARGEERPVGERAELELALSLADVLRAARSEIAALQDLINDPDIIDKGIDGASMIVRVRARLVANDKSALLAAPKGSRGERLMALQFESIGEVIDENRAALNRPGVGFKGFVPAVFARLVNERFGEKAGHEARIKVTAPVALVRNRKARPDDWERAVLDERFASAGWPRGALHAESVAGTDTFRVMVPEYYSAACLDCHGGPPGELDVTGYPKEGGELDALAGSISITLNRR